MTAPAAPRSGTPYPEPLATTEGTALRRRLLLLGLAGTLPACSLQTPYVEPLRFPLTPLRTGAPARAQGRRTLLLRLASAAPGLEGRLLRTVNPDGTVSFENYAEWTAAPAEGAEAALRQWLIASGLFSAVLSAGSRATADLVLEMELTSLHADLGRGEARAALSAVLLRENGTVAAQSVNIGTAPLPADRPLRPEPRAQAMVAALGNALSGLEAVLARFA